MWATERQEVPAGGRGPREAARWPWPAPEAAVLLLRVVVPGTLAVPGLPLPGLLACALLAAALEARPP